MKSVRTAGSYLVDIISRSVKHNRPNQHLSENVRFRHPPAENIGAVRRILGVILSRERKAHE